MKFLVFFTILLYSPGLNRISFVNNCERPCVEVLPCFQQQAFYFINSVPSGLNLYERIDLSFFANQIIVFQYRFKLEIPIGMQTTIDKKLVNWSPWIKNKMTEIIVPKLDLEGRYKLLIEYKTPASGESLIFTKYFYVISKTTSIKAAKDKPASRSGTMKTGTAAGAAPGASQKERNTLSETIRTTDRNTASGISPSKENGLIVNQNTASKSLRRKTEPFPEIRIPVTNQVISPSAGSGIIRRTLSGKPLSQSDGKRDSTLLTGSVQVLPDGGNAPVKEEKITERNEGNVTPGKVYPGIEENPINAKDKYGNSKLHIAILQGDTSFARSLIDKGADLNLINQVGLSPLHLAVISNNELIVTALLEKGAEIDIQGNEGYTPLHIAAELNNIKIANDLLMKGARSNIKTRQKLTPAAIARIQNNAGMMKLISRKGSDTLSAPESLPVSVFFPTNTAGQYPKIDFILPYDRVLAEKRQFYKLIQFISVPVFALSAAGSFFLRSEANSSFSSYKTAETEDMARHFYNRTLRLDRFVYVSGTISLASVYGFIHTTIKKKSITDKMRKTFY